MADIRYDQVPAPAAFISSTATANWRTTGALPWRHSKLLANGRLMGTTYDHIHLVDTTGKLLWRYQPEYQQHHDFLPLPNGNVLLLLREIKTPEEVVAAGANPAFVHPA